MHDINALAAWTGVVLGIVTGAAQGLFFHRADWLGGYDTWPRRLLRLGHVSFFGIAALNLGYAVTVTHLRWPAPATLASVALAAANVLMPMACALAAWRPPLRHLFDVPVSCVLAGITGLLWARLASQFAVG